VWKREKTEKTEKTERRQREDRERERKEEEEKKNDVYSVWNELLTELCKFLQVPYLILDYLFISIK
jgi:hypothetical protein